MQNPPLCESPEQFIQALMDVSHIQQMLSNDIGRTCEWLRANAAMAERDMKFEVRGKLGSLSFMFLTNLRNGAFNERLTRLGPANAAEFLASFADLISVAFDGAAGVGDPDPDTGDLSGFELACEVVQNFNDGRLSKEQFHLHSEIMAALTSEKQHAGSPIPMILHCPTCHEQHIDKADPDSGWENPPHRSHLCGRCGAIWRPADVETVGVEKIMTAGKHDNVGRTSSPLEEEIPCKVFVCEPTLLTAVRSAPGVGSAAEARRLILSANVKVDGTIRCELQSRLQDRAVIRIGGDRKLQVRISGSS